MRHVVAACYLGWMLDAFDFFIMVFVFSDVAASFGTSLYTVTWAVTATLMSRAIGALVFGRLADRFGRRPVLMASVLAYSVVEFLSGFAPNLASFLMLRALFGIAMGGEWGIGASLTMETVPTRWRGAVSGILQAGYPSGYLLATLLYWLAYSTIGWRGLFMVGALPALLVLYIRRSVPESPEWIATHTISIATNRPSFWAVMTAHKAVAFYAVAMMTAFNFLSHGTQDLYPNAFLKLQRGFSHNAVTAIALTYNVGAILGGLCFGWLSQRIGRRGGIGLACFCAIAAAVPWVFSAGPVAIGLAAFAMQFFVQGAWGVVPAYLNELSPPAVRATFPGLVYQVGNCLAAANAPLQSALAVRLGGDYRWPLLLTVVVTGGALMALMAVRRSKQ